MPVAYARAVDHYGQSGPLAAAAEQSPHQLIECLLAGALARIAAARQALAGGDEAARRRASSRVVEIVGYLDGILDEQAGGEVARGLRGLYEYCVRRLFQANLHRDDAAYAEVAELLGEIKRAWDAIPSGTRQGGAA